MIINLKTLMTLEELNLLKRPEIKELVFQNLNVNTEIYALKHSGEKDLPYRAISEQIYCNKKAKTKLPLLSKHKLLYEKTALEQCSSEITAKFKTDLIEGNHIIDLTGGLGIDSISFSKNFDNVVYCEQNDLIKEISSYNLTQLKIQNVIIKSGNGLEIIQTFPNNYFDWIYIDPSRRVSNRRTVGLQNCAPNVLDNLDLLFQKSNMIMIKASPAIELEEIKKQIKTIKDIYIVSVDNECKEVLIILHNNYYGPINIFAALLNSLNNTHTIFSESAGNKLTRNITNKVLKYLYEPDAAIIKARLTSKISALFNLFFLNNFIDFLVSDNYISDFPGRTFNVIDHIVFNKKTFKDFLTKNKIDSANITRRDFPDSPEVIRKKFKIKDGGENYLFFTKNNLGELISIFCKKINKNNY